MAVVGTDLLHSKQLTGENVCERRVSYVENKIVDVGTRTHNGGVRKNKQNKTFRKWRTEDFCCEGYQETNRSTCEPVCKEGCANGSCTQPDQCVCYEGYVLQDTNTSTCVSCLDYCEDNNCAQCSCSPGQKKSFSSNCSSSCEKVCVTNACTDTPTCPPNHSQVFGALTPSEDHTHAKVNWTVIGFSLGSVVLMIVLIIVIIIFVKKKKKKKKENTNNKEDLFAGKMQDDLELVSKSQDMINENILYGASDIPYVTTQEDVLWNKMEPTPFTTNILEEDSLYEKVEETSAGRQSTSGRCNFYEQAEANTDETQNTMCEDYSFYEQVKTEPSVGASEDNSYYEEIKRVPDGMQNVENILYGKIKAPEATQDVSEENILYGKIEGSSEATKNVSEENILYGKI